MTREYVLKVVDELNRLEEACNNARVNYRISEVKYVLSNVLDRARRLGIDKIQSAYARHDGDLWEVTKYIRRASV